MLDRKAQAEQGVDRSVVGLVEGSVQIPCFEIADFGLRQGVRAGGAGGVVTTLVDIYLTNANDCDEC